MFVLFYQISVISICALTFIMTLFNMRWHGGAVVLGFIQGWGLSVSPRVCVASLQVHQLLPPSKGMHPGLG